MSQATIRRILESRVAEWAAAAGLPVAWENVEFRPPEGAYARAFVLPGPTDAPDLQAVSRRYVGVLQVSLVMPRGAGLGPGVDLAESLAAMFPPSTLLSGAGMNLWALEPLSIAPPISEGDRIVLPCSVPYFAHVFPAP